MFLMMTVRTGQMSALMLLGWFRGGLRSAVVHPLRMVREQRPEAWGRVCAENPVSLTVTCPGPGELLASPSCVKRPVTGGLLLTAWTCLFTP